MTPWERVKSSPRPDDAFRVVMGVDVALFQRLLDRFGPVYTFRTLPRNDVNPLGRPRRGRRSLMADDALALGLHYLASPLREDALQRVLTVPAVTSRLIRHSLQILLEILRQWDLAEVAWPEEAEMAACAALIARREPLLRHTFGFTDGLRLPVAVDGDPLLENAYYNGWTADHNIANLLVFGTRGTVLWRVLNVPGSQHDSYLAHLGLYDLLQQVPAPYNILGDSAFALPEVPHNTGSLLTPFKENRRLPRDPVERARVVQLDRAIVSHRQNAEWGMRAIQSSFERLRLPLPVDASERALLLQVVVHLHQLRVRVLGINQTARFYEDREEESFSTLRFSDIRARSRARTYYDE